MIARIGTSPTPEAFALASLLEAIDRLPVPAERRRLLDAVADAHAAAQPDRRPRLRALLAQAHAAAAERRPRAAPTELGGFVRVVLQRREEWRT